MVEEQWVAVTKPSRSDEVVNPDQQLRIANQIRAHFDSVAPKRPTKPTRSESDGSLQVSAFVGHGDIPELQKLRSLRSQSPVIFSDARLEEDEFVETRYYQELGSIPKQHHTTGSGFIQVVNMNRGVEVNDHDLQRRFQNGAKGDLVLNNFKSNPATNDWIPNAEEQVVYVSSKPSRSESC